MAQYVTNYNSLIAEMGNYCEDASSEFTTEVQACVNRAEERIFRDLDLSLFNFLQSTSTGSGASSFVKPSDMQQSPIHNVFFTASKLHAQRRSLAYIQAHGGSGRPCYFAESDSTIYWSSTTDADYAIIVTYNKRWTPLASGAQTNWVTANAGDLLLYASLVESERFLLGPERTAEFETVYRQLLGPVRAFWRGAAQTGYEPVNPTPTPQQTR